MGAGAQHVRDALCNVPSCPDTQDICPKAMQTRCVTPVFPHTVDKSVEAEGREQEGRDCWAVLPNPYSR